MQAAPAACLTEGQRSSDERTHEQYMKRYPALTLRIRWVSFVILFCSTRFS
jgi:hypothetical protein